jgi:hypothetical protein
MGAIDPITRGQAQLDALALRKSAGVGPEPRAILTRGDTINPEPIAWLWPEWLAAGKLHLLAGAPGTGKTTIALKLAATVTCGGRWPDGSPAEAGSVVIWSGEDDPADVLIPRLIASGADMARVRIVDGIIGPDGRGAFDPARDVDLLAAAISDVQDARLLIVDPIVTAVAGDSHKNAEVRRGLQPLVDMAHAQRFALLGITHLSKGTAGRDPVERVTGSLAFGALARVVLMAAKTKPDDDKPAQRLLMRGKSNVGPDEGGYSYELRQSELAEHPGVFASSVQWVGAVQGTARELMADAEDLGDERGAGSDTDEFLRELLSDGPRPAKEIYAEAKGAGYSEDSMKRAKVRIGASVHKQGMAGGWVWQLPSGEERTEGSEGGTLSRLHSSRSSALPSADGVDL